MFRKEILAVVLTLILAPAIFAQGTNASISGTVTDESRAVIPGVDITVTNLGTGIARSFVSNDQGRYLAPALPSGNYEVKGALTGFQTSVRTGIVLSVAREAVVNLTLTVGSISEQVTVTGEAALVDTRSQTMGGLVNTQQIADLPLNGRSVVGLTLLEGGVHQNIGQSAANTSLVRGFGMVINVAGARGYMNSFLLDGVHSNDHAGYLPGSIAGVTLGVDSIQEFKMQTANFGAEYGSAAGGVVTAITKSGSNEFHGNAFWFHRNDNLDANTFIDNSRGQDKAPFIRNQFGATLGGPIVKDSTFFFFNYEGLRDRIGLNGISNVLNPNTKLGILPSDGTPNSRYGRDSAGNTLPLGLCHPSFPYDAATDTCRGTIDPRVVPYLDLWPTSNGFDNGDGTAELLFDASEPTDENFYAGKVDHTINDTHSMFFRFQIDDAHKVGGSNGMNQGLIRSRMQNYTPELRSVLSPNFVNVVRASYVRRHVSELNDPFIPVDPSLFFLPFTENLGALWIAGTGGPGTPVANPGTDARPRIINNGMWQFSDSMTYTRGNHSLKFGVDVKRWQVNMNFVSRWGSRYQYRAGTADLEAFLLANPQQVDFTPADGSDFIRGFRQTDTGLYIQDDWQYRPNLTFNLGLRYEFQTVPTEVNGKIANIRNPYTDTEHFIGDPWFENPSLANFAPRIGIAWDPTGDGRTSIRTGFGMFYSLMNVLGAYQQPAVGQPPAVRIRVRSSATPSAGDCFPDPTCSNFYTSDFAKTNGLLNAWQYWDLNTPYMMKWNLDIQRELTPGLLASVGYIGSRGVHQWMDSQFNSCFPEFAPSVQGQPFYRGSCNPDRNSNFTGINLIRAIGGSQYHAMVVKANRRFANGVAFQASYTWSKSTDDDNGYRTPGGPGNTALLWKGTTDNPKLWKGLSNHDVRANFSFNASWALPGPQGGWAGALAGGWQINGILALSSGPPFTPSTASGNDRATSSQQPGNLIGPDKNPIDPGNIDRYYDTSVWVRPTIITDPNVIPGCTPSDDCEFLGTGGRNTVIGPGVNTFDFSLFKQWSVPQMGEQGKIEFRSEFFNIFNRANFAVPSHGIGAGSAGRITAHTTTARQVQFGLKIMY